jgi:hypothetical protein
MEDVGLESWSLLESKVAESGRSSGDEYEDEPFEAENSADTSLPVALGEDDAGVAAVDEEAEYDDESFEEEDADNAANDQSPSSCNDTEQLSVRGKRSDDTSDSELNRYEDEEFDNEECGDAEMPHVVESTVIAAFGENDTSSARLPDYRGDVDGMNQNDAHGNGEKERSVVEMTPVLYRWCELKMMNLSISSEPRLAIVADRGNSLSQPQLCSAASIDASAISKLMDNARVNRDRNHSRQQILGSYRYRQYDHAHISIVKHTAVPTSLIDRGKTSRFFATTIKLSETNSGKENGLSVTNRPPKKPSQPATPSLSTFISVKTADLRGKLATASLDDMCVKWMQPSTRDINTGTMDADYINVGTLELLEEMAQTQREIIGAASADGGARGERYAQRAAKIARRIRTTKRQLKASMRTRQDAHAVLNRLIQ